jgi:hypothetical protein
MRLTLFTPSDPQAFNLLLNVVGSGTISSNEVVVPQPEHLAIAATMLVHPNTTTGAELDAEKEAPNIALRLLRLTHALIGSKNAHFHSAFNFTHFESTRQGTRRDSPAPGETILNDKNSLWATAEDFWHAVGWAFNCSVSHPARWKHWQIWLQFICTVLEDDWNERESEFLGAQQRELAERSESEASQGVEPTEQGTRETRRFRKGNNKEDGLGILRESLIFKYIASNITTYGRDRRIMRAIFADGQPKSAQFSEVFKNELRKSETKQRSSNSKKRSKVVNVDKGEYGDYQSDSDDEYITFSGRISKKISPPAKATKARPTKRTRRGTRNVMDRNAESDTEMLDADHAKDLSSLGGYNSLALRQRLLGLLSSVSTRLPKDFVPVDDLYHMFAENIRDLSLPIFQHFITPSNLQGLTMEAHCGLCELLLYLMRESSAPPSNDDYLTSTKLQQCFLPYGAASPTIANNAKISMLLEAMITILHHENAISATPQLKNAAQAGIAHRESASLERGTVEWSYLWESGVRIKFMLDHILP